MITEGRIIPKEFKKNGVDNCYEKNFRMICENIKFEINEGMFVYFIDSNYVLDTSVGMRYENLTPNYERILNSGLKELKYPACTNKFCEDYNSVIDSMCILASRVVSSITEKDNEDIRADWFRDIVDKKASSFCEAIQRMLFLNQLLWQTDHRLTGLGAWDTILYPYYKNDLENGNLSKNDVLNILKEVYKALHNDYEYKSNVLMGDTGQIFVIGRSTLSGDYICNELTYLFIEAMKELHLPEPKCLLRVNKNTPKDLLELSLKSISTGIGAPLFANDDVIVPRLIEFGIKPEDALLYTTSACWEPLIGGKSSSLNNRTVLNFLKAFDNMMSREKLDSITSFEDLIDRYLLYLKGNLKAIKRVLTPHRFEYDPLLSIFIDGCYERKCDISQNGAEYHNVGITSVAMGNLIDSLFNIRDLVFEKRDLSLVDIRKILINNYEGEEELKNRLMDIPSRYGSDNPEVIDLVKKIMDCVSSEMGMFSDYQGGRLKVGLSGSAYMDVGRGFGASFDGRSAGEPFTVHISNEDNNGFTEIINFSSDLEYGHALFNGNVVDLMVSPSFIKDNWDKFVLFIQNSIKRGFFEMQMNVVSSADLIAAKKNPEKYPNLIVRVWGFSSYFNDLPEEYKDLLIQRALKNEKIA